MKKLSYFIAVSLLLSCTSNTIYKKPADLIPRDTMILLLKEMYIASSAKSFNNRNLQRRISYLPLVYDTYKIDSLRFKNSNFYYTSKFDEYEKLLQDVLILIKEEQSKYVLLKKERDSITQDSIRKILETKRKLPKGLKKLKD